VSYLAGSLLPRESSRALFEEEMKSPLSQVKASFESKENLVAELEKLTKGDELWVARTNKDKGLAHVSNAKLLRLHRTFTAVKEKFGTRAKLIDAIAELEKRTKDEGYKARLGNYPVPRLWDMYQSVSKRTAQKTPAEKPKKRAAAKAAPPKAREVAVKKKTAAKKTTAKKKSRAK
jgi:hypothetical protein